MVKICFCAIFKNESRNVYRCLNAAKEVIDYVSICDTGSTDNTVELIERWGNENKIPTKVHHETFKNFGYNRTLSVKLAKESYPAADYILLLDADMILKVNKEWKKQKKIINDDYYMFNQKNDSLQYWNVRMIKASYEWKCVGVTHEYWECISKKDAHREKLTSLWIDDREDGGCKDDKYERDERLLLKGLEEETDSHLLGRYKFYLAQTYRCMNNYPKAIQWYRERIKHDGWDEEIFYSQLQIGICYEKLKSYEEAAGEYLLAWDKRPHRAEPLYYLSKMYRENSKHLLSYTFAKRGLDISYPKDDSLFIEYKTYLYKFHFEISICAWYLGQKFPEKKAEYHAEGLKSASYILSLGDQVPQREIERTKENIKFYL